MRNDADLQSRAKSALEYLGYTFPDKYETVALLPKISPKHLLDIYNLYKNESEFLVKVMKELLDQTVFNTCSICEKEVSSYSDIPEGWGWHEAGAWYLMCEECQTNYTEKFNKLPEVVRNG